MYSLTCIIIIIMITNIIITLMIIVAIVVTIGRRPFLYGKFSKNQIVFAA